MKQITAHSILSIALVFGGVLGLLAYNHIANFLYGILLLEISVTSTRNSPLLISSFVFVTSIFVAYYGSSRLRREISSIKVLEQVTLKIIFKFIFAGFTGCYILFAIVGAFSLIFSELLRNILLRR